MTNEYLYRTLSKNEQFLCKLAYFLSSETDAEDNWAACEEILFTAANHLDLDDILARDDENTTVVEYWSDRCAVLKDKYEAAKYLYEEKCKFPKDGESPLDEALRELQNEFKQYNIAS